MNEIKMNVAYKINPEFDGWSTDIYYLSRFNKEDKESQNGLYFVRMVDGERESEEHSFFKKIEIEDGVLIEA